MKFVFSLSCFLVFFTLFNPVDCQCDNCMDGVSTLGCPSPSLCGYRPFDCTPCLASPSSSPSSNCTAPLSLWCVNVSCHQCIDRMPSQGCRDPAVCGLQPMPCKGCVKGKAMPGCPHPEWCGNFSVGTPPCYRCMGGMVMPHCPDPHQCGYEAACQDCMPGMPMPSCPDPDACAAAGAGEGGCVTQMYFHLDDSACILIKRWNIGEKGEWVIAVILIIMAAYAREGIAFYRSYRLSARKKAKHLNQSKPKYSSMDNCNAGGELKNSSSKDDSDGPTIMPSLVSLLPSHHSLDLAIDSFCYCLQQALSYLLMLVIMTYSFYLFITVIGGFSIAHFTINYSWAKIKQKKTKDLLTNISIINESINANIINNDNNNNNSNNNGATGVTGASGVDPEQKTGGDHCCEDFEFDD